MKYVLNQWQWAIEVRTHAEWMCGFYPYIRIYCVKFTSLPPEGELFTKEHYQGFYWSWHMRRTIVVTSRTIVLPVWLLRALQSLGIHVCQVYRVPYKISLWL